MICSARLLSGKSQAISMTKMLDVIIGRDVKSVNLKSASKTFCCTHPKGKS